MNRTERSDDPQVSLRAAFNGLRSDLWTAIPGIIESYSGGTTCEVQPAIKVPVRNLDGTITSVALPLLVDCPVQFPSGGNCTLTFPVKQGDECLVVFSSRCIDGWWQSGGVQEQAELRMHDLSDGFAILGFRSSPRALAAISGDSTQLRSDDGATYIDLNPVSQKVKIVAPGGFDVVAPISTFSGQVNIIGLLTFIGGMLGSAASGAAAVFTGILDVTGQILANGKRVDDTHTHHENGAGSNTNPPN